MTRLEAIEYAESELRNKSVNFTWSTHHVEFYQTCLDALREVEQLKNELRKSSKLPVMIGQIVYVLVPFDKPTKILTKIIQGYNVLNDEVYFETETFSHPISHFGTIVFTSERDAYKELTKRKGEN